MLPTNHSDIAADFASHLGADVPAALTSWRLASQGMSDETIFATVTCPEAHELVIRKKGVLCSGAPVADKEPLPQHGA